MGEESKTIPKERDSIEYEEDRVAVQPTGEY